VLDFQALQHECPVGQTCRNLSVGISPNQHVTSFMKHFREHILLVLLGLFLVQFAALLTFTKGFITTRVELPHKSHCDDFSSRQSHSGRFGTQQHEQAPHLAEDAACWSTYPAFQPSHQVKKVVLMIVDALRADFFYVPDDSSAAAPILRQYNLHMPRLHLLLQQAVREPQMSMKSIRSHMITDIG